MKNVLFIITAICISIAVFVSILAVWGTIDSEVAWKTVATVCIVFVGTMAFNATNNQFEKKSAQGKD